MTLIVSGLVIAVLQILHSLSYDSLTIQLSVSFVLISAIGVSLYQGTRTLRASSFACVTPGSKGGVVRTNRRIRAFHEADRVLKFCYLWHCRSSDASESSRYDHRMQQGDRRGPHHSVGLLWPGILLAAGLIVITGNAGIAVFALGMLC